MSAVKVLLRWELLVNVPVAIFFRTKDCIVSAIHLVESSPRATRYYGDFCLAWTKAPLVVFASSPALLRTNPGGANERMNEVEWTRKNSEQVP